MKKLIICGKANIELAVDEFKEKNSELWMLGTDPRNGADKYFELHGIKVNHENTVYELPDEVYEQGLPINNSISALLIHGWLQGYKTIEIIGAPMNARDEYINERPSLAFVVGYIAAQGVKLSWDGMVENTDYGRKKKPEVKIVEEEKDDDIQKEEE
ncbi:MAG: hypothetical protein K5640_07035 [Treponema sp.]|nr:hypothetical protein [Treponema sp.]